MVLLNTICSSKVRVEFKGRTNWRLKGMEVGSKTCFSKKDVVGDIAYSAACAYGDRVRKVGFEVGGGRMQIYLEVIGDKAGSQRVDRTKGDKRDKEVRNEVDVKDIGEAVKRENETCNIDEAECTVGRIENERKESVQGREDDRKEVKDGKKEWDEKDWEI